LDKPFSTTDGADGTDKIHWQFIIRAIRAIRGSMEVQFRISIAPIASVNYGISWIAYLIDFTSVLLFS
jgi:hypothetical protein